MGLTLWIDENTFATHLLEKVFKKKNLELYTLNKGRDFAYLIQDLRPSLLVLDHKTISKDLETFKSEYFSDPLIAKVPVIMIDGRVEFIPQVIAEIKRPFDPFHIPEMLETHIRSNGIS